MTVTSTSFRADLPEFSDITRFPDATVNFWLGIGTKLLDATRWGDLLDFGLELFTAHNLSLSLQGVQSASTGNAPGIQTGAVSGKSVDKVSVSYDSSAGLIEGAGNYNLTTYGTRFIQLANMIGAGGIQL